MRMILHGGPHLQGRVSVMGAKNAALPLIASTLLLKGETHLKNVPRLTDVMALLEIMQSMGAKAEWEGEHELVVCTDDVDPKKLDRKKMKRLRGSILLLGPMLARFKKIHVPEPGGCIIGARPIEEHLKALGDLGAKVDTDEDGCLFLAAKELIGGNITLQWFSVTATETVLMAAAMAKGKTRIRLAAAEPHVQELCRFLQKAGAKIKGVGTHFLEITGVETLKAPKVWKIIPDMIEIGTFAAAAALTRGEIEIAPVVADHLDAVTGAFAALGVICEINKDVMRVKGVGRMDAFRLQTRIYPGFPTDLQAPFGLLATQCHGTSLIHDPVYESRMGYMNELIKMGANAIIADPHRVIVTGPTPLRGTEIRSLDLRAGATMVLAGLIAEGETVIHDAEMVYRGYEALDERLRLLGADIAVAHDESII